jgi:YidC/Oxa1 family membrane protein insertase
MHGLMEKRTIIAFVLSFAVLLLWSYVFAPKEEQVPPKGEPPKETAAPQSGELGKHQPSAPVQQSQFKEQPSADESLTTPGKDIVVETPLYVAVFSNTEPAIKSFKLKDYTLTVEPGSPPVDLSQLQQGSHLKVYFEKQTQGQEKTVFRANSDSLVLNEGSSPKDLIYKGVTPKGVAIQQQFRIYADKYPIDLSLTLSNGSDQVLEGSFRALIRNIHPKDKSSYYSFAGAALLLNGKIEEIASDDMAKEKKNLSGKIEWVSFQADYFMTAVVPENPSSAGFNGWSLPSGVMEAEYIGPPLSIPPQNTASAQFSLYLGPRDVSILKELGNNLDLAVNFGWTDIIAKPLLYALRFFNGFVHNYGISIILLTVLIKILFWPLTHKSYKSMKEMQKIQPLMAKIREKYKGNKEQMNKEMMALYKTYKVNPMGGCLPMVIQIPVFFALFRILGSAIELRHAPFVLWIHDLAAPDRLFRFPFEIPYMTPPYGIPVLTLLMGVSMFFQQKLTPTPGDPMQAKIMMFLPLIFTAMFINFPSGLVLYWLVNNILSIGQQYRIIKRPA